MASVTRTVGASGKDHATIQAAIDWLAANWNHAGSDVATIELHDDAVYTTPAGGLDFSGIGGTPSPTSYVRIFPASVALWCKGQYQGARIENSSGHAILANLDYLHVKGVAIKQAGTGTSAECGRISGDHVLFEKCYGETNNIDSQDVFYATNVNANIHIFDCLMNLGGPLARGGVHMQANNSSPAVTQTWNVSHCTVIGNGASFCYGGSHHSNSVGTMNFFNCAGFDAVSVFNDETSSNRAVDFFRGHGNISDDGSAISYFRNANPNSVSGIGYEGVALRDTDSPGLQYLVENIAANDYSLRRGESGADVARGRYETDAILTIDPRIDTSVDIANNARPAADADRDIGCFQSRWPNGVSPTEFRHDEVINVTGGGFGATQGAGTVVLSDTNQIGTGTDVDLDTGTALTAWGDGHIQIDLAQVSTATKSELDSLAGGARFVIVSPASGPDQAFSVTTHRAQAFRMKRTANLSPFGEGTTAQLLPPGAKSTADFEAGTAQGDVNPGPSVDLSSAKYREDEWCIEATPDAVAGETYQFRVLLAAAALDAYALTPGFTITGEAPPTTVDLTDSGAGADSLAVDVSATLADLASGADSISAAVAAAIADSGNGADQIAITATTSLADSASGSESLQLLAVLSLADAGAGADSIDVIKGAFVVLADSGSGSEALDIAAAFGLADAGSGADSVDVLSGTNISLADSGVGTDSLGGLIVAFAIADTGSGADEISLDVTLTAADGGSASESITVGADLSLADTASAVEQAVISAVLSLEDSGTAVETVSIPEVIRELSILLKARRDFRVLRARGFSRVLKPINRKH